MNSLHKLPAYAVIIRCIHERGDSQDAALAELFRRGLWLTKAQEQQAGLLSRTPCPLPGFEWASGDTTTQSQREYQEAHGLDGFR
jgi:hypothetical protein